MLCREERGQIAFEQGRHPSKSATEGQLLELHLGTRQATNFELATHAGKIW